MKICVLIPSYNESKTIGPLVEKVKAKGLDVLVVDDGSIDQTYDIAQQSGAHVLRHQHNKGKGASLKTGFRYILENDYDAAIIMDGDGQHSPEDLSKFTEEASNPEVDIVVGNRMIDCKNMPRIRWLTNKFMSSIISLICQKGMADSQCGFRLIKRKALAALHPTSSNYEIESETIIEASHKGFKIKFV
ncbi:MAG: glycosyltransferase family 2 protein, partial [Omnitrophica bacterium]|nr:glycosyltransferase family 2 protein [Candidatus Omnitrophota bacterium]